MKVRLKWFVALFLAFYTALRLSTLATGYKEVDDIGPLILFLRWQESGLGGMWHQLRIWT